MRQEQVGISRTELTDDLDQLILILPDHILSCVLNRFDAIARDTYNLLVPLCLLRNDRYPIIDLQIRKVILLDTADCDNRLWITRSSAVEHVFVFEKSL